MRKILFLFLFLGSVARSEGDDLEQEPPRNPETQEEEYGEVSVPWPLIVPCTIL